MISKEQIIMMGRRSPTMKYFYQIIKEVLTNESVDDIMNRSPDELLKNTENLNDNIRAT